MWIGDPIMARFRSKWAKHYETAHEIHLLVYYNLQSGSALVWPERRRGVRAKQLVDVAVHARLGIRRWRVEDSLRLVAAPAAAD